MTSIQLHRFVHDNNIEYHWSQNKEDVYLMVMVYQVADFNKLLGFGILDEGGIECAMKNGYFVFEMGDICEYFGIELKEIFPEETNV